MIGQTYNVQLEGGGEGMATLDACIISFRSAHCMHKLFMKSYRDTTL